jgi:hypothetical protein
MISDSDISRAMAEAEKKAWVALAGYKFYMFGYWAAKWVSLNSLSGLRQPNPFKRLVAIAREATELHGENAASSGHAEVVRALLDAGADIHAWEEEARRRH